MRSAYRARCQRVYSNLKAMPERRIWTDPRYSPSFGIGWFTRPNLLPLKRRSRTTRRTALQNGIWNSPCFRFAGSEASTAIEHGVADGWGKLRMFRGCNQGVAGPSSDERSPSARMATTCSFYRQRRSLSQECVLFANSVRWFCCWSCL